MRVGSGGRASASEGDEICSVRASTEELVAFISAINETLNAIEDWELQTRTGFDRGYYLTLMDELRDVAFGQDRMRSQDSGTVRTDLRLDPAGTLQLPDISELASLPVDVQVDDVGYVKVLARAADGDTVELHWPPRSRSAGLGWMAGKDGRAILGRDEVSRIAVLESDGAVEFRIWSGIFGRESLLVVTIGEDVSVRDTMLDS